MLLIVFYNDDSMGLRKLYFKILFIDWKKVLIVFWIEMGLFLGLSLIVLKENCNFNYKGIMVT